MSNFNSGFSREDQIRTMAAIGTNMIHQRAWECYNGNNNNGSVEHFQELVNLANRRGDVSSETSMRFWLGTALHGGGHLLQAAAAMGPALEMTTFEGDQVLQNRLVTRFILVAVDIPLALKKLEESFAQAEGLIEQWGWEDKESRLPLAKGRLALFRGQKEEGLRWAQIAMDNNWNDSSAYATHTYLTLVIKACVDNNRLDLLKECLAGRHRFELGSFRISRRMTVNVANAEICLADGDMEQALEYSRLAEEGAWLNQDHTYSFFAFAARVRILLAAGRTAEARPVLARLLRSRHAEVEHDGFQARVLLGDFYLAEGKRLLENGNAGVAEVDGCLGAAVRAYGVARRVGMEIDERLECCGKRDFVDGRLGEVDGLKG